MTARKPRALAGALRRGACGAALLAVFCSAGHAGTLTGNVLSTINLTSGCVVVGGTIPAGSPNVSMGTLNFGTKPATFTGQVTATLTGGSGGSGATQVECSSDVLSLTITIDGGLSPGQGTAIGTGTRAMVHTANYVPYDVFQDSGNTIPYPIGTPVPYTVPTPGTAFSLPIYGLVNKTGAGALPPGIYNDTLVVTLTF